MNPLFFTCISKQIQLDHSPFIFRIKNNSNGLKGKYLCRHTYLVQYCRHITDSRQIITIIKKIITFRWKHSHTYNGNRLCCKDTSFRRISSHCNNQIFFIFDEIFSLGIKFFLITISRKNVNPDIIFLPIPPRCQSRFYSGNHFPLFR